MEDKTSKPIIKRKALLVSEKLDIINYVSSNPNLARVIIAKQFQLPVSILNSIVAKRDQFLRHSVAAQPHRKRNTFGVVSTEMSLEHSYPWYSYKTKSRRNCIVIEHTIHSIKLCAGIVHKTVCGESASVSEETASAWENITLPPLLAEYKAQDVFNADECGISFNLLPDSTFAFKGDKCHGNKKKKIERASRKNLVASKSEVAALCVQKQHVFLDDMQNIFQVFEWFGRKNGIQNRNILLFMDQCAAYLKNLHTEKCARCVPASQLNISLQPLDQGII
ncbi:hypothetical protein PR048_024636 [Dryococelus australis]|uniref:HTH psq-type domain-containing protein n=1 Tax=Dryococelus australis TaxID=614101 RepID=A0ABQ9GP66_9NEOP|nr:hypothetical protein PR048_024636 [Dryococelus australis]